MNLSKTVTEGIQLASDTLYIKDDLYPVLVQRIVDHAKNLGEKESGNFSLIHENFSGVDVAVMKAISGSYLTLVLKSIEMDAGESVISSYLEDCKYMQDRITTFVKILEDSRAELRLTMSKIGHCPPHIVDVSWRLDYHIKNNMLEKVDEPTYLINLQTERSGGLPNEDVLFECSIEQLKDLVSKLKEATKCMERLAQT